MYVSPIYYRFSESHHIDVKWNNKKNKTQLEESKMVSKLLANTNRGFYQNMGLISINEDLK